MEKKIERKEEGEGMGRESSFPDLSAWTNKRSERQGYSECKNVQN